MKRVLVIGAARSGVAISRLLAHQGYQVFLTDQQKIAQKVDLEALGVTVIEGGHPDWLKNQSYEWVIKNPGIASTAPFVSAFSQTYMIHNEIDIALRFAPNFKVAAITGTNGKTTTTALLGAILQQGDTPAFVGGNIGIPISEIVDNHPNLAANVSCEIAAFQLDGCDTFHPRVATILNLSPDHLDVYGSVEPYYCAKRRIYQNMVGEDVFVLNLDDPIVSTFNDIQCRILTFSLLQPADACVKDEHIVLFHQPILALSDFPLVGQHNVANALAAMLMAHAMGYSNEQIALGILGFKGVEHRIEFVMSQDGVRYFNDSKGTNTDATIVALKSFESPVILIAGGYDKKTGFEDLRPHLHRIKSMIVYGATKFQLKELYPEAILCENLEEAVAIAKRTSASEDVVLFSPACASWDQFDNFEVRGKLFKELVHQR